MFKIRGNRRLAPTGHENVASSDSDPPADHVFFNDNDVLDPDPIRWALPEDGNKPVHKGSTAFSEVQLVHMYHLGHIVGWSLEKYHNDRTILTQICEKIGISRDQFRGFVYSKKFTIDKADSSASASGSRPVRGPRNLSDESASSSSD